ncbi:MAG TPA: helix-turn-helix transcriptional regulator [Elusimicrobiota bacterium]|nr:helix-turn-helix transcriptional regulator [Elusimicrobiota bacterium]
MSFVRLVREQMKEKGLSIRQICRSADIDPSFFAKVLRGERRPPDDEPVLRRLAQALSVDLVRLMVSVGRLPESWRAQCERPDVMAALNGLFSPERALSHPPRPAAERTKKVSVPSAVRKAPPPERVPVRLPASALSEDLL